MRCHKVGKPASPCAAAAHDWWRNFPAAGLIACTALFCSLLEAMQAMQLPNASEIVCSIVQLFQNDAPVSSSQGSSEFFGGEMGRDDCAAGNGESCVCWPAAGALVNNESLPPVPRCCLYSP